MFSRRQFVQASAAAGLAGCSGRGNGLRVWAMGVEGEALGAFAADFEKRHAGVRIAVQALPWSAAHEKLLTAFAADALPDVLALGNTWLPEFAALGALQPHNRLPQADRQSIFPAALQSVTIDGRELATPWYLDTRLLFYRRDLLERAGFHSPATTWAQWDAQLAMLSGSNRPGGRGLLLPINEYDPLVAFCLQADAPLLLDGETRGGFRRKAVRDCFAYVASLYKRGYAAVVTNTQVPDLYGAFARGEFAFLVSGPWNLGEFARRLPAELQDQWATAPLPGPSGPGASLGGGVSLCVVRGTPNTELAAAFIEFLSDPGQQAEFYRATGDLPADIRAWTQARLMQNERTRSFYDQLMLAKPPPKVPEWERIANEMAAAMERAVRGIETLDAALARLDAFADKALAKRRWLRDRAGAA